MVISGPLIGLSSESDYLFSISNRSASRQYDLLAGLQVIAQCDWLGNKVCLAGCRPSDYELAPTQYLVIFIKWLHLLVSEINIYFFYINRSAGLVFLAIRIRLKH